MKKPTVGKISPLLGPPSPVAVGNNERESNPLTTGV
jgi:hypothetical protein